MFGNIPEMFGNILKMFGNILKMFGNILKMLGNILKMFGNIMKMFGNIMEMFGNIMEMLGNIMEIFVVIFPFPFIPFILFITFNYILCASGYMSLNCGAKFAIIFQTHFRERMEWANILMEWGEWLMEWIWDWKFIAKIVSKYKF